MILNATIIYDQVTTFAAKLAVKIRLELIRASDLSVRVYVRPVRKTSLSPFHSI